MLRSSVILFNFILECRTACQKISTPFVENIFAVDEMPVLGLSFVFQTEIFECVIPGFRSEVDENCALLGYYAASSGNF